MGKKQGSINAFFQPVGSTSPEKTGTAKISGSPTAAKRKSKEAVKEKQVVAEDDVVPVFEDVKSTRPSWNRQSQRVTPNRPKQEEPVQEPKKKQRRVISESDREAGDGVRSIDGDESILAEVPQVDTAMARAKLLGILSTTSEATEALTPEKEWTQKNSWTVNLKDANGRSEEDPAYDRRSLLIPKKAYERLTPFQKQFWDIKKEYFDVILMFKKGKFYEMYDRDADVGASVLNLNYTGGGRVDMRCVGVPEQSFAKHVASLVEAGYKVGRVEQIETFNAAKKRRDSAGGGAKSQICQRALVKIVTKGTVTDEQSLSNYQSRYVISIVESGQSEILNKVGVCYVDVAASAVHVSEFEDDDKRTWLGTLMALLKPKEIVVNTQSEMSDRLKQILNYYKHDGVSIVESAGQRNNVDDLPDHIAAYISEGNQLADVAIGLCRKYLNYLLIEKEVFSMGNFKIQSVVSTPSESEDRKRGLILDEATLSNLEVLTNNNDRSENGTVISFIDRAVTAGGKRLLRRWLVKPLYSSDAINDRFDAVDTLSAFLEDGQEFSGCQTLLASIPDVERGLAKIHTAIAAEENVVMFDDTNKRKVVEFTKLIKGLKNMLALMRKLKNWRAKFGKCKSERLGYVLEPGSTFTKEADAQLKWFFNDAFDFSAAENGEVKPLISEQGDEDYRKAAEAVAALDNALEDELDGLRNELDEPELRWYHRGKEGYQVEVPKTWFEKGLELPTQFSCLSQSQACHRYWTPKIERLFRSRTDASETLEEQESSFFKRILAKFDALHETWISIEEAVSEFDALLSLALVSTRGGSRLCRPKILPNGTERPVLSFKDSYHPLAMEKLASDHVSTFVPNDVALGGEDPMLIMLTGPNMGGKSTLLRQVCISVILAQVGCYVPAQACTLTPVDRIFTRIGAHDQITKGQSTFMVEMEETATILNAATKNSLLILDELGRGTSTFDGYAIAHAVVDDLSQRFCRTMFSTHYHLLTEDFKDHGEVVQYQMDAKTDEKRKDVTFLYKLVKGVAPYSRGIQCARLAKIPSSVADSAERYAADIESSVSKRLNVHFDEKILTRIVEACTQSPAESSKMLFALQSTVKLHGGI